MTAEKVSVKLFASQNVGSACELHSGFPIAGFVRPSSKGSCSSSSGRDYTCMCRARIGVLLVGHGSDGRRRSG